MATAEEKRVLSLLRKVPILSDASVEVLSRLLSGTRLLTFRPRQVVYLPGDRADAIHFVAIGRIKVSKVTRDGKELTLAYQTTGDFFGEPCLLEGRPREEMAEAMEPTTTLEVDRQPFDRLLSTHVGVGYRFARSLITRRRDLETKVEQLIFKDVSAKLAELLLGLSTEHGVAHEHGTLIGLKITHQEMANLIGSTRETVSLTLSQFKKKGLLTNEGRRLIVIDAEGLRGLM